MQLVKNLDNVKKHCIIEVEGIIAINIKEIKKRKTNG